MRYIANMQKLRENYDMYLQVYEKQCAYSDTYNGPKFHLGIEVQEPVITHGMSALEALKIYQIIANRDWFEGLEQIGGLEKAVNE